MVRFDLEHLLHGQMRIAKLKVLITHLLLVLVCVMNLKVDVFWTLLNDRFVVITGQYLKISDNKECPLIPREVFSMKTGFVDLLVV